MRREAYFLKVLKGEFLCQVALGYSKMPARFRLESAGMKVKEKTYLQWFQIHAILKEEKNKSCKFTLNVGPELLKSYS